MKLLCSAVVLCTLASAAPAQARTVVSELRRMERAGAIGTDEYRAKRAEIISARKFTRRLRGTRRAEMRGVLGNLEAIAARGSLTVGRLRPLFTQLRRNRQYWCCKPLLGYGARYSFPGSELVWQHFPGQGINFHPLASFGKLNGLWQGRIYDDRLAVLLDELLAMAAPRGDGLAWEYYFRFNGGQPPWVSGLAQATALQALARAGIRLGRKDEVMAVAEQGVSVFETPPPVGVRKRVPGGGVHYLLYSFRPRLYVLNGFAQALIGLNDYAKYANSERVRTLFADGERAARREVPRHDTGFWSLYSRGVVTRESDLGYHKLTRGFLAGLCERTLERTYCETEENFGRYLVEPPVVDLGTERARGGTLTALRFRISKISRVSVKVAYGNRVVLQTGGLMRHGGRAVAWRVPRKSGRYDWRVTATDLAGNSESIAGVIEVLKPRRRRA